MMSPFSTSFLDFGLVPLKISTPGRVQYFFPPKLYLPLKTRGNLSKIASADKGAKCRIIFPFNSQIPKRLIFIGISPLSGMIYL